MRRISIILYTILTAVAFSSCKDFLETKNLGQSDNEFVTSSPEEVSKVLSWAYGQYRTNIAAGGNYNWQDPLGSDAEYMSEFPTANNVIARLQPEAASINNATQFNALNIVLARVSRLADALREKGIHEMEETNIWTHLYGEAITMKALCSWELVRHFGDVPYGYENQYIQEYELSSRFDIMDQIIDELTAVEGSMFRLGESGITAERLNRSYANALIGEIALHAGGWQTIRTDMDGLYGDVQFEHKGADDGMCVYARRKDFKDYIQVAEKYLNIAIYTQNGSAQLITTDNRSFNNPFQVHWQEINSRRSSPESFFEISAAPGHGGEHPYSQGRPGSNNNAVSVLNTFAAIRIIPSFFYNAYEPGDKRRDVSMVVTGSDAATGRETLVPLGAGTRIGGGGPSINKWDQNRGDDPLIANNAFRGAGMNYTILRVADAMLMLAEAKALLGDDAGALELVNQIRERAFGNSDNNITGKTGEELLDAIYEERKLELLGEGDIRWDMIRSGKFNERAIKVRQEMEDMMAGLAQNGYYTFESGRTISNYIWTKHVQINPGSSQAVVTQESTSEEDPALYPGWRGIFNWNAPSHASVNAKNLAIEGLYRYIDPNGAEAAALEADGYEKTNWGITMLSGTNPNMYKAAILDGVGGRENYAPRYFHPMPLTVIDQSKGAVTNGYGLPNN